MGRVKEELAVNLELLILEVTDKAVYAKADSSACWIPKSVIVEKYDFTVGTTYPCTMPNWFVDGKGLDDG